MPHTTSDEVEIYYEVAGGADDPVIVLISGGGAQLISWHVDLVADIVTQGFRVVRMDNRDTGLSQRFGGEQDVDGGYDLTDMADDVVRVLDDLGIGAAHLVGHSLGGMIAQLVSLDNPDRVLSLGLLSTIPGRDPKYMLHGQRPALQQVPSRLSREQIVAAAVERARVATPARYDPQLDWHAWAAGEAYDRGYAPDGTARQWSALLRAPDRLERLRGLRIPTLVLHGRDDDVLHWRSAVDIAEAIDGAELQIHPDMGHLIPHELWPDLVAGIVRTARRGEHRALTVPTGAAD